MESIFVLMSDFTTYDDRGTEFSSAYPMYLYVYPNTLAEESLLDSACQALVDMGDQLMDYDAIDFYEVNQYDGGNGYPTASTNGGGDCLSDFKDWCEPNYGHLTGNHLVIENDFSGGATYGGTLFDEAGFSACGYPWESEGQATVIHETIHKSIKAGLVVGSDPDDLAPDNEHELGKVENGTGDASPMCNNSSYVISGQGECSTYIVPDGEHNQLTHCSKEGVYRTAREVL